MEVILRRDVDKVGLRGEVVNVARGYARNFLLPRGLADEATPARVAEVRKVEERRAHHEAKTFEDAQGVAERLGQIELRPSHADMEGELSDDEFDRAVDAGPTDDQPQQS